MYVVPLRSVRGPHSADSRGVFSVRLSFTTPSTSCPYNSISILVNNIAKNKKIPHRQNNSKFQLEILRNRGEIDTPNTHYTRLLIFVALLDTCILAKTRDEVNLVVWT